MKRILLLVVFLVGFFSSAQCMQDFGVDGLQQKLAQIDASEENALSKYYSYKEIVDSMVDVQDPDFFAKAGKRQIEELWEKVNQRVKETYGKLSRLQRWRASAWKHKEAVGTTAAIAAVAVVVLAILRSRKGGDQEVQPTEQEVQPTEQEVGEMQHLFHEFYLEISDDSRPIDIEKLKKLFATKQDTDTPRMQRFTVGTNALLELLEQKKELNRQEILRTAIPHLFFGLGDGLIFNKVMLASLKERDPEFINALMELAQQARQKIARPLTYELVVETYRPYLKQITFKPYDTMYIEQINRFFQASVLKYLIETDRLGPDEILKGRLNLFINRLRDALNLGMRFRTEGQQESAHQGLRAEDKEAIAKEFEWKRDSKYERFESGANKYIEQILMSSEEVEKQIRLVAQKSGKKFDDLISEVVIHAGALVESSYELRDSAIPGVLTLEWEAPESRQ